MIGLSKASALPLGVAAETNFPHLMSLFLYLFYNLTFLKKSGCHRVHKFMRNQRKNKIEPSYMWGEAVNITF